MYCEKEFRIQVLHGPEKRFDPSQIWWDYPRVQWGYAYPVERHAIPFG